MSLCNTNIKYVCTQNHPLQERPVWRIIFHAVRPFGRCVGVEVTCAGSRVLAHSGAAAFLFFKQSIAQCAPLYKPFRQKPPKYRHGVAHGPGGGVRARRPTDNMATGESGASGKSAKRCRWQRERAGFEEVPAPFRQGGHGNGAWQGVWYGEKPEARIA